MINNSTLVPTLLACCSMTTAGAFIVQQRLPTTTTTQKQYQNLFSTSRVAIATNQTEIALVKNDQQQEQDYVKKEDESLLLSQALDPNNKRNGEDNKFDDPLLPLLHTNTHIKDKQLKWYAQLSPNNNQEDSTSSSSISLPFDCTGCGKCCQTIGEVYLNPSEIQKTAETLNISIEDLKQKYSSREIKSKRGESENWIVLKQKYNNNISDGNGSDTTSSCIFLDDETKHCMIYEARPLQCSTYPFWPRIMDSIDDWNEEVVSNVEDNNHHKVWTPEGGGCEGMRKIEVDEKKIFDNKQSNDELEGVQIKDALERLESYTRYKRAFPM